eukprot:tig00021318_g20144.t1
MRGEGACASGKARWIDEQEFAGRGAAREMGWPLPVSCEGECDRKTLPDRFHTEYKSQFKRFVLSPAGQSQYAVVPFQASCGCDGGACEIRSGCGCGCQRRTTTHGIPHKPASHVCRQPAHPVPKLQQPELYPVYAQEQERCGCSPCFCGCGCGCDSYEVAAPAHQAHDSCCSWGPAFRSVGVQPSQAAPQPQPMRPYEPAPAAAAPHAAYAPQATHQTQPQQYYQAQPQPQAQPQRRAPAMPAAPSRRPLESARSAPPESGPFGYPAAAAPPPEAEGPPAPYTTAPYGTAPAVPRPQPQPYPKAAGAKGPSLTPEEAIRIIQARFRRRNREKALPATRSLPDTTVKRMTGKPVFHSYGRKNTHPAAGRFISGEYMLTHNVTPHEQPNRPERKQVFGSAVFSRESMRKYDASRQGRLSQLAAEHAEAMQRLAAVSPRVDTTLGPFSWGGAGEGAPAEDGRPRGPGGPRFRGEPAPGRSAPLCGALRRPAPRRRRPGPLGGPALQRRASFSSLPTQAAAGPGPGAAAAPAYPPHPNVYPRQAAPGAPPAAVRAAWGEVPGQRPSVIASLATGVRPAPHQPQRRHPPRPRHPPRRLRTLRTHSPPTYGAPACGGSCRGSSAGRCPCGAGRRSASPAPPAAGAASGGSGRLYVVREFAPRQAEELDPKFYKYLPAEATSTLRPAGRVLPPSYTVANTLDEYD